MLCQKIYFRRTTSAMKCSASAAKIRNHVAFEAKTLFLNVPFDVDLCRTTSKLISIHAGALSVKIGICSAIPQITQHSGICREMLFVPFARHSQKLRQTIDTLSNRRGSLDFWNVHS